MAAQDYARVLQQIKLLEAQAKALREKEVADVVKRIREAINVYDITPSMLFGGTRGASSAGKRKGVPAYSDGKGNVWGGRGPRPMWLREALASGGALEDFRSPGLNSAVQPKKSRGKADAKMSREASMRKGAAAARYRDESGNTWGGRGPRPRWLRDALAAGRQLDDFLA